MKKRSFNSISRLVIMFLFFDGCSELLNDSSVSNKPASIKGEGLCIYPTEIDYTSDLTYQNFDVEKASITGSPIIYYSDIINYDTTTHILKLSCPRDSIKNRIGTPNLYGKPFLVTLDSSKIYGGWFWIPISSIPCNWVVIEPDCLFDSLAVNEIRIKLGYPTEIHFEGEDPRNNKEIISRLIEDGKAK